MHIVMQCDSRCEADSRIAACVRNTSGKQHLIPGPRMHWLAPAKVPSDWAAGRHRLEPQNGYLVHHFNSLTLHQRTDW